MERTLGWRHFHVTDKRRAGQEVFVCMVSTCDSTKKLWMNVGILKSRQAWAPGWLRKEELTAMASEDSLVECKACSGGRPVPLHAVQQRWHSGSALNSYLVLYSW